MSELVEKLEKVQAAIEAERGPLALLGLFKREDDPLRWDLAIAAPWLRGSRLEGLRYLDQKLRSVLDADEMDQIALYVPLMPGDEFLDALEEDLGRVRIRGGHIEMKGHRRVPGFIRNGDHGFEIQNCELNGIPFRRVVLFTYDPVAADSRSLAKR